MKRKALENTPNPSGSKGKEEPQEAEQIAENLGKVHLLQQKIQKAIIASYKS